MEKQKNKVITIYDIANEAGVSPATVSRVLTNAANVRPEKKEKILALIEKYNFQPNSYAKGLSNPRTKLIGMVAADVSNPFYGATYVACEKAAMMAGYRIILLNSFGDIDREIDQLNILKSQHVNAIIQLGGKVDDFETDPKYVKVCEEITKSIPMIVTGHISNVDCCSLRIDAREAASLLTHHLIQLGHKKIALVGGRLDVLSTYDKYQKYCEIMNRFDIPIRDDYLIEGGYDHQTGYEGVKTLLGLKEIPTAIIAINDFCAAGIMRGISELGFSIPGDISVVSYDNTYIAELLNPKLTSIDYDYPSFGQALVDAAISRIEGIEIPNEIKITPKLIVRSSSGQVKRI